MNLIQQLDTSRYASRFRQSLRLTPADVATHAWRSSPVRPQRVRKHRAAHHYAALSNRSMLYLSGGGNCEAGYRLQQLHFEARSHSRPILVQLRSTSQIGRPQML